jgi:hypothetical protein
MEPFVRSQMSEAQIQTYVLLNSFVRRIPSRLVLPSGNKLNCHILARVMLLKKLPLKLHLADGWYLGRWPHAWLWDSDWNVFDVLPVRTLVGYYGGVSFVDSAIVLQGPVYESFRYRRRLWRGWVKRGQEPPQDPHKLKNPFVPYLDFQQDIDYLVGLIGN